MKKNNNLSDIAKVLLAAESVFIFPHISMDGDAMGSAASLCLALRESEKDAWILIEDEIPDILQFLNNNLCTTDANCIKEPDVCICLDCAEASRFPKREKAFLSGKTTACVDHHVTASPFADYSYIDPNAAATAEIVYELILLMGINISKDIGLGIYTGIVTDTGGFQYSNTTKKTHLIAAELFDAGIDHVRTTIEIYQNVSRQTLLLKARIMQTLDVFADGQCAVAHMTKEMLRECSAKSEEAEGVVEQIRNIKGVEIAGFIKEKSDGVVKISMRSKSKYDVTMIANHFEGGGHVRAAGYSRNLSMEEALSELKFEMENLIETENNIEI